MNGPTIALVLSVATIAVWGYLVIVEVWGLKSRRERRRGFVWLPIVGLLSAIGMLASGLAYYGAMHGIPFSDDLAGLISSMGRGALLAGGLIAAVLLPPPRKGP